MKPETVDLNQLIKDKVTSSKEYVFIYLTYAIPRSSEHFTPYSLKEARYSEIDCNEFFTVDREGVTYFSRNENYFTNLQIWQTEYELYQKMIKVMFLRERYKMIKNSNKPKCTKSVENVRQISIVERIQNMAKDNTLEKIYGGETVSRRSIVHL